MNHEGKRKKLISRIDFLAKEMDYFSVKVKGVTRDQYFADPDIRHILNSCINDIILCCVDIAANVMLLSNSKPSRSYRETVLSAFEFLGDIVYSIAPLTKRRNEVTHEYLKLNWDNIQDIKESLSKIREFSSKAETYTEQLQAAKNTPSP